MRVPYYSGDLKSDANLENYPCPGLVSVAGLTFGSAVGATALKPYTLSPARLSDVELRSFTHEGNLHFIKNSFFFGRLGSRLQKPLKPLNP